MIEEQKECPADSAKDVVFSDDLASVEREKIPMPVNHDEDDDNSPKANNFMLRDGQRSPILASINGEMRPDDLSIK